MSEGSNVPRDLLRNKSWLHSEPCLRTRQRLLETRTVDFASDIDNLRRTFADQVRRVLSYRDDDSQHNETTANVDIHREYSFGEVDNSVLPAQQQNEAETQKPRRKRLPSGSSISNLSERGEYSLTSYDSSVFEPDDLDSANKEMAHASNQDPPNLDDAAIDREIGRLRADMAQRSRVLENVDRTLRQGNDTPHETTAPSVTFAMYQALVDGLRELRVEVGRMSAAGNPPLEQRENNASGDETYRRTEMRDYFRAPPRDERNLRRDTTRIEYEDDYRRVKHAADLIPAFDGSSEERLKEFLNACSLAVEIIPMDDEPLLIKIILRTKLRGLRPY